MATKEQLKKAREKAVKSPKTGKRGKGKKTIEKEIREETARDYFIKEVLKQMPQLTKKEITEAMKDFRVRHYVFDQLMGRAKDKSEVDVSIPQNLFDLLEKAYKNDEKPNKTTNPDKS